MASKIGSNSKRAAIQPAAGTITLTNRWHNILARWGINRNGHRVDPGLYALGNPTADSPVFVTANYMLSFDALRSALAGIDGYILVLDTKGINVWCAAGSSKGFILGGVVALPFLLIAMFGNPEAALWQRAGWAFSYLLALPPVTAYLSLNFTGATTFTSRSGVKREIFIYIPLSIKLSQGRYYRREWSGMCRSYDLCRFNREKRSHLLSPLEILIRR